MTATRRPGQRAGLSRDAVLGAARSLIAARGLAALTMRALADTLGVAPNAIYSHVANKAALVDDLLDDVLSGVVEPAEHDAAPALRGLMTSTYEVLLMHPDLVPLYLARQGARGPNAQRLGVIMDDLLGQIGLTGSSVGEARRVLIVYTIGFAAFSGSQVPLGPDDGPPLPPDHVQAHFERGLSWLLAGINRPMSA